MEVDEDTGRSYSTSMATSMGKKYLPWTLVEASMDGRWWKLTWMNNWWTFL